MDNYNEIMNYSSQLEVLKKFLEEDVNVGSATRHMKEIEVASQQLGVFSSFLKLIASDENAMAQLFVCQLLQEGSLCFGEKGEN